MPPPVHDRRFFCICNRRSVDALSAGRNAEGQLGTGGASGIVAQPALLPVCTAPCTLIKLRCPGHIVPGHFGHLSDRLIYGVPNTTVPAAAVLAMVMSWFPLLQLQPAQRWVGLAFGDAHGAGVTDAGRVFTWGDNIARQLGQDAPPATVGAAAAGAGQPAELAVLRGLDVKLLSCGAQVRGSSLVLDPTKKLHHCRYCKYVEPS